MHDDYVSTEHLLLAMLENGDSSAATVLARVGVTADGVLAALTQIRGTQRVTSENPEATYESLTKYGRDLTEAAERGVLDPVIGRDEEIRAQLMRELQTFFRPEFLNRVDEIIVFHALGHEELKKIANLLLDNLRRGTNPPRVRPRRSTANLVRRIRCRFLFGRAALHPGSRSGIRHSSPLLFRRLSKSTC